VSIVGSTRLDLREAVLPGPEAEIELRAVLGSMEVTVPEGVAVEVSGGGLMLSHEVRVADAVAAPGAPTIRIRIRGTLGSVKISDRPSLGAQIRERVRRALEP
jgi:hypothetical protein